MVLRWIFKQTCRLPFRMLLSFCSFRSLLPADAQHAHGRAQCPRRIWPRCPRLPRRASSPQRQPPTRQTRCARAFAAGSATTAPPELKSQNGVLEVTFKFLTATDSQGLVRYCYVTDTGLQAPTLRVNPGDQLIIHFQNDLACCFRNQRQRQYGRHEDELLSTDGHHQHQQRLQWNDVGDCDQYPLPWNECGAGLRAG